MPVIFIAFTILLTKLLPLVGPLALLLVTAVVGEFVGNSSQKLTAAWFPVVLLVTYLPGALASFLFIHFFRLKTKLSKPIPGLGFLVAGIVLTVAEWVVLILPTFVSGLERSNMALQLIRMAAWLTIPLLLVGVVKVFLSIRSPALSTTAEPQPEANTSSFGNL